MNLPRCKLFVEHTWKIQSLYILIPVLLLFSVCLAGCGDNVRLPTTQELIEFENASPPPPSIDTDRMVKAKIGGGPYRAVTGDALELTMPAVVRYITAKDMGNITTVTPYISRVNTNGNITLPIIGDIEAAGRTLPQIESDIIDAYYPKHVVTRPSVYARVLDYKTFKVSITGAVMTPGIYSLRNDQMSLVALLMEAGGIINEGAALIRINHSDEIMPNNEDAVLKTAEQTLIHPDSQNITSPVNPAADQIVAHQNEIPPFFRHAYSSSAIGALATRQNNNRLLTERTGITDNYQRPLLVDRLAPNKPPASNAHKDGELFSPAKPVEYGYKKSNLINTATVASSNLESHTHNLQLSTKAEEVFGQDITQVSASNRSSRSQRITNTDRPRRSKSIVLPVKGLNIPFADVALQDGDSVIVERLQPPLFTVMELVNRPGNFPYPPDVQYTLMQAIGFAGGLNLIAEPRYATIYRLKRDGTCISAIFPIKGKSKLADASNTLIKPGDIIALEHTPRTRTALFLDRTFRISIGTYWRLNDSE
ncbi:MAG: polysaccharide biosynthesis/export family protein [Planctomycetota bacterium]|jgi:protein involved in polysaccharide export with SLBB domain